MNRRQKLAESSEAMRQVRMNQPSATPEEMRAQLERNRSNQVQGVAPYRIEELRAKARSMPVNVLGERMRKGIATDEEKAKFRELTKRSRELPRGVLTDRMGGDGE